MQFQRTVHGADDGWAKISIDLKHHLLYAHEIDGDRLERLLERQEWDRARVTSLKS
jgi:hypothetical protein